MESVWTEVQLPHFAPLAGDISADVLVIGGGMAGLLCAHALTEAGAKCVIAEASVIAGGITKNTTAKITSQHGLIYHKLAQRFGFRTAGLYLEANERAVSAYRALCEGIDCDYCQQDNYIYSHTDRSLLEKELSCLHSLGFPASLSEDLPLPFPTVGAVKFPRQGQFHPLKFLAAISSGLTIFEHTPVRQLTNGGAVTDRGTIRAEKIIAATHFPFLNKHGSYFLKLYQQRPYAIALENVPIMDGMYLDEADNGISFRSYGKKLILGGGGHRTGKHGGNWQELEAFAAAHYPDANITQRWATQDCMTLDGIPYIGRYSARTPNLYVATGFNKWGMTGSMTAALLLKDQLLDRENSYARLFDPARSMLHPKLGLNILESALNLLTPTRPRCPHQGCALKWNPWEHSWDCPCHGSRFDSKGKLLDTPAIRDMKDR